MDDMHLPWLNGFELFEDVNQNKHFLPIGCEGIDMLLGGGLCKGQLTELVGPSSSGKTQFCLFTASSVGDANLGTVMYLDTCNSFSSCRIAQFIQLTDPYAREESEKRLKRILSNIICQPVYDIHSLMHVLHEVDVTLCQKIKDTDRTLCLLVIDSISSLITPILGGKGPLGRSFMVSTGVLLKKLANDHNLAVLVTNHMVGGEGGIPKPALGESWKTIPHVRLILSHDQGSHLCNVSILKHTNMASGCTAKFVIHQ